MINLFRPLFTLGFWFRVTPLPFTRFPSYALFIVSGIFLLVGAGWYMHIRRSGSHWDRERRRVLASIAATHFWVGLGGFFLYAMTWQAVPVLGMRFLWLVLAGTYLSFLFPFARHWFTMIPAQEKERAEREAYEKWLPKPKH